MKNWKGTTGEWAVNDLFNNQIIVYVKDSEEYVLPISENKFNAQLIADAGNTIQKCNLIPSELLRQRDELIEKLKYLIDVKQEMLNALDHCRDGLDQEHEWRFDQAEELIRKIKKIEQ